MGATETGKKILNYAYAPKLMAANLEKVNATEAKSILPVGLIRQMIHKMSGCFGSHCYLTVDAFLLHVYLKQKLRLSRVSQSKLIIRILQGDLL